MKKEDALELLKKVLGDFCIHKRCLKEIADLLKRDLIGKEKIFFDSLTTQLANIKTFGLLVYTLDNNEQLKGYDGHYISIHLEKKQFNIRLIVYIDNTSEAFLLHAFYERSGKRHTDYSSCNEIIQARLQELREDE